MPNTIHDVMMSYKTPFLSDLSGNLGGKPLDQIGKDTTCHINDCRLSQKKRKRKRKKMRRLYMLVHGGKLMGSPHHFGVTIVFIRILWPAPIMIAPNY